MSSRIRAGNTGLDSGYLAPRLLEAPPNCWFLTEHGLPQGV